MCRHHQDIYNKQLHHSNFASEKGNKGEKFMDFQGNQGAMNNAILGHQEVTHSIHNKEDQTEYGLVSFQTFGHNTSTDSGNELDNWLKIRVKKVSIWLKMSKN